MTPAGEGRPKQPGESGFPVDFVDFVHAMNTRGVEYLLVGGYAVGVYGHVRATVDIDFFYRRTSENVTRLLAALQDFGAPPVTLDRSHLEMPDAVTAFGEPPMRIDLLSEICGVSFDAAQVESMEARVAGEAVPVIGLAALLANKRASGRRKDLDDLAHLSGDTPL